MKLRPVFHVRSSGQSDGATEATEDGDEPIGEEIITNELPQSDQGRAAYRKPNKAPK